MKIQKTALVALSLSVASGCMHNRAEAERQGGGTSPELASSTPVQATAPPAADRALSSIERADQLIGESVLTSDHQRTGKIADFVVDEDSGQILYAIVGIGGVLGVVEIRVAVPPGLFTQAKKDAVQLKVDKHKLTQAPHVAEDFSKDVTVDFLNNVYGYFGQTAAWQRSSSAPAASSNAAHKVSDLIGVNVVNSSRQEIGKVRTVVLNVLKGHEDYVVLSPSADLNLGNNYYALPPQAVKFSPDQKTLVADPAGSARTVGLRYVSDRMPGIRREPAGTAFRYRYPIGEIVQEREVLQRIRSLAIPPAWMEVWICPDPFGHLQATGYDARKRKQYRYHRRWRETREETKYAHMIAFGKALPKIRQRVGKDLSLPGLNRRKVLATVVRLLERSLIRVGNEEYERENDSFGLTTLKNRHVDVNGSEICFHFRGKAGKKHRIDVLDRRLAQIVRKCQELPGQELFQYFEESGGLQDVKSTDVNEYLREIGGQDFTAKDFRTWAGTILAAVALQEFQEFDSKRQAKKNIVQAIESVAARLGNTPAICKKCYVHPHVLEGYLDGTLVKALGQRARNLSPSLKQLQPEEAAVLALLQRRLAAQEKQDKLLQNPFGL